MESGYSVVTLVWSITMSRCGGEAETTMNAFWVLCVIPSLLAGPSIERKHPCSWAGHP